MKHVWWWVAAAAVAVYLFTQSQTQTAGQEKHPPVSSTNSWTVAGGWYSQHFPFGAQ